MQAERYGISIVNDVTQNRMLVQVGLEQKHQADSQVRRYAAEREPQLETYKVQISPEARQALEKMREVRSAEEVEEQARFRGQDEQLMSGRSMGLGEEDSGAPQGVQVPGSFGSDSGTDAEQQEAAIMGARTLGMGEGDGGSGEPAQVHVPGSFGTGSGGGSELKQPEQAPTPSPMPQVAQQSYSMAAATGSGDAPTTLNQLA